LRSRENEISTTSDWPELVFGLVGPIGVDMSVVERKLEESLAAVHYQSRRIKLTELMRRVAVDGCDIDDGADPVKHFQSRIDYANAVRKKCEDDAALAALGIVAIRENRIQHWKGTHDEEQAQSIPIERTAYIIRQLKRPEEIELLRRVYGRKFVQISVHASERNRQENLERQIGRNDPGRSPADCRREAAKLIDTDINQRTDEHGQRVEDVFYRGDAFIDGRTEETTARSLGRFIQALFGKNSISPTRDEYGAYIAASASLRSIDLSRQVGAAIFSPRGEVISLGCNEVPKFGGGTYWTEDDEPHRDYDDGVDSNRTEKSRIIFDFLNTLEKAGAFAEGKTADLLYSDKKVREGIKDSPISDITEFGRMTHAEMTALCDAARLGRSVEGSTIYVTTFPCHNCAKHLIAAGIHRVVFIEPYPKSKALAFHSDSAILDQRAPDRVVFQHFIGISPRRYRDIFEKAGRRNSDGSVAEWHRGEPIPMIEDKSLSYVFTEDGNAFGALKKVAEELGIKIEGETATPLDDTSKAAEPQPAD
jgi:deoxycytidylate deaminase